MFSKNLRSAGVVLVLSCLFFVINGCTLAKISGRGSVPLMLNNPPARVEVVSHFSEQKMVTFDYTSAFDVSEILSEKLSSSDADAVTNVTVTVKTDPATFCVNLITLGIANAKIFQVEGDLIKAPQGLGSIIENSEILVESDNIDDINAELRKLQADENVVMLPSIVRTDSGYALIR